ncbi:MAG: BrnT family toxin [Rhizobiaceae bacterium]
MKITFDPRKREITLQERGLDFADAAKVFEGTHTVVRDDRFDYGEARFISAGFLEEKMVVMVWTQRGTARHIISMRHCHEKEERRWRRHLG